MELQLYIKHFVERLAKERILPRIYSYILGKNRIFQPSSGTNRYAFIQTNIYTKRYLNN